MIAENLEFIRSNLLNESINTENTNTLSISISSLNYLIKAIDLRLKRGEEEGIDTTKLEDFLKAVERTTLKVKKIKNEYIDKNIKDFSNYKNGIKKLQKDIEDDFGFLNRYLTVNNTRTIKELKISLLISYTISFLNLILNKIDLFVFSMSKQLTNKNNKMLNKEAQNDSVQDNYVKLINYHTIKMLNIFRSMKETSSVGNEKEGIVNSLIELNRDLVSKYSEFLGIGAQSVGAGFTSTLRKGNQKLFFAYISKNLKNKNLEKIIKNT